MVQCQQGLPQKAFFELSSSVFHLPLFILGVLGYFEYNICSDIISHHICLPFHQPSIFNVFFPNINWYCQHIFFVFI